jgi:hypothetical protein
VPQQHCQEMAKKMLPTVDLETWSTATSLHKGYHPKHTADEGGLAEKSQECRRYPPLDLLKKESDQCFGICIVELTLITIVHAEFKWKQGLGIKKNR